MILLIGGGDLLYRFAKYEKTKNKVIIVSSQRMLKEKLINEKSLE